MKIGIVALILLLAASAAFAADVPMITLKAESTPIDMAVADISSQAGVQIVCESGLKATVTAQFESIELEKLLDAITQSNNLKWQKLYLPDQPEPKLTADQMKARAEAVAAIVGGPVIVCDPVTGKQKVFVEQEVSALSVDPGKLGMKPVYLISKPKVEAKDSDESAKNAGERYKSLEKERIKLLAQMTPEERVKATQDEMTTMMNLDPDTRQKIMLDQWNARRNMDPQIQDDYRQMMRDTMRSMREQGLIPERDRDGGGRGGRNRDRQGDQ